MEDKPKRDPQKRVTIVPDAKGGPKSAGAKPISAPISAVVAPSVPAHFKDTRDSTTNWRSACQKIVEVKTKQMLHPCQTSDRANSRF